MHLVGFANFGQNNDDLSIRVETAESKCISLRLVIHLIWFLKLLLCFASVLFISYHSGVDLPPGAFCTQPQCRLDRILVQPLSWQFIGVILYLFSCLYFSCHLRGSANDMNFNSEELIRAWPCGVVPETIDWLFLQTSFWTVFNFNANSFRLWMPRIVG